MENIFEDKIKNEKEYYEEYYQKCKFCICPCLCCLKEEKIKKDNKNISEIVETIKEIEKQEKDFDKFIEKKEENGLKFCQNICLYIFYLFIALLHYFSIAQINSVMYFLFGEAKKFWFIYTNQLDKVIDKSFPELVKNSNTKDTSQINYFYLSSIIT